MKFICPNLHAWYAEFTNCICPWCGKRPVLALELVGQDGGAEMKAIVMKLIDLMKDLHEENKALRLENCSLRSTNISLKSSNGDLQGGLKISEARFDVLKALEKEA